MSFIGRVRKLFFNLIFSRATKPVFLEGIKLQRMGSVYGGWHVDTNRVHDCYLVSAGLGEDASFDIEFVSAFGSFAFLIDPTPRAIEHFDKIIKSVGRSRTESYSRSGVQPIGAYDLRYIDETSLNLLPCALWKENGQITFYAPENFNFVSHSVKKRGSTKSINVDAITLETALSLIGQRIDRLQMILKIDIEGAEVEVLENVLASAIRPKQILVEWDFMRSANFLEFTRFLRLQKTLSKLGYVYVSRENWNSTLVLT